jgi:glutathione S-transferase
MMQVNDYTGEEAAPMSILIYDLVGADAARPFSPHCWKVAFALPHKGLAFERVPARFTEVATLEGGTNRTVPIIRDGEAVVIDSFAIALYLEETYADRPSLFGGEGGKALARFIEKWSMVTIHPFIARAALMDIHDSLDAPDQAHFRATREKRFGKTLEEVPVGRDGDLAAFRASLAPLRMTLGGQPFLHGAEPGFGDYIVAGAFQWARVISPFRLLESDDVVADWFERCLDLHGGLGREVPAAA